MRINIVGAAPSSAHLAPSDSPSWVCGEHHKKFSHLNIDRIYEIHEHVFRNHEYAKELIDSGIDTVVQKGFPFKGGNIREYDFERCKEMIGRVYLTSTVSYMISDAIAEGYDEIYLYGITLTADSEYFSQRPCMEWWVGFAQGKGIKVVVPVNCPVSKSSKLYGLDFQKGLFGEDSLNELKRDHELKLLKIREKQNELNTMEIAQIAAIDLLEKLATISRRNDDGEVIKRLTDSIRVK